MFDKENPLYRLYEEVINQKRLEVVNELYAPNYVNRIAPFGLASNVAGVKKLFTEQMEAFPDWHITVNYIIEHGNKYIMVWTRSSKKGFKKSQDSLS
ncbi:MAG: ester cyclase [Pseudomonadota bacterium]